MNTIRQSKNINVDRILHLPLHIEEQVSDLRFLDEKLQFDRIKDFLAVNPNDYIIRLTPFLDDMGNWTGELLVGTVTTDENNLTEEDHFNLMGITRMVCASVPAMEENDQVRDLLNIIVDRVESEPDEDDEPQLIVSSVNENVINVNFKSKGA